MSSPAFALIVLASFLLPIPFLVWFDRPRREADAKED